MWRFIFSFLFLALGAVVFSQQEEQTLPPVKKDFRPYELKLGFNAIRSGRTAFGNDLLTHEVQGMLAFHKYALVVDVGIEEHSRGDSFGYENKGGYFRSGLDWNITKDYLNGTVLSLGLRYARANFEDNLIFIGDQGFGEQTYSFSNPNLRARWFEVTFSLRGQLVSNLYMGFTMRWQTLRKLSGEGQLKSFEIPGFGKTSRENSTAFDYYIMWRIPFRKDNNGNL